MTAIFSALLVSLAAAPSASAYTEEAMNRYWEEVKWRDRNMFVIGKDEVVGLGIDTCEVIKNGGDFYDLAEVMIGFEPEVQALAATSMAFALVYLCGER